MVIFDVLAGFSGSKVFKANSQNEYLRVKLEWGKDKCTGCMENVVSKKLFHRIHT